jgi:UrcA family protein
MNLSNSIWDRRSRSVFVLSALTFGLVGTSSIGASAADDGDVLKTTVRIAPGELATDSGAQALYRRLTIAANQVCPQAPGSSLFISVAVSRCREHAVRQAVMEINNPRLMGVLATMMPAHGVSSEAHSMEHSSRPIRSADTAG